MSSAETEDVVIIGAGPAGLTAAFELGKRGVTPRILEKTGGVGGISCTETYRGFHFDMGGHRFFTKSERVMALWREMLGEDFLLRPRLSRIYYRKHFFHYPLRPLNALAGLGLIGSTRVAFSYAKARLSPSPREETFQDWVTNRFGRCLFETFFESYTEKVWGIPCTELRAEWAAQRIQDLSLKKVLLGMVRKPGSHIRTLIEEFHYPRLGPGMMWRAMERRIEEQGSTVEKRSDVRRIRHNENRVRELIVAGPDGESTISGSHFISSMPLRTLVLRLDPAPPREVIEAAESLKYRDFLTVCLILDAPDLFPDNWIYVHDPDVSVARIQNYKNWSPDMVPDASKSGIGLEYFCTEGDELWTKPDEELISTASRELERLGLARGATVEGGCVYRIPKSYPIYDSRYGEGVAVLREYLGRFENLQTVGRNGLHRYNNQDHSMLTGLRAAENCLGAGNGDVWDVNVEQEYLEELQV